MNKERRKVIAGIFADLAKYMVGAGILAGFWTNKLTIFSVLYFLAGFAVFSLAAFFLTPKDDKEG